MRKALCTVGTKVIIGRRDELNAGTGGSEAIIIATGRYTDTWASGCPGVAVREGGSTERLVLAVQVDHRNYDSGQRVDEVIWAPRTAQPGQLMEPSEYAAKAKARREVEAATAAHQKRGREIRQAIDALLAPHLGKLVSAGSVERTTRWDRARQRYEPAKLELSFSSVYVADVAERLPVRVQSKLATLLAQLDEWAATKDPGSC